ncbi:MAG: hydrogenase 2 operon protein HybA [Anaeromyxobacter sp.]
MSISRRDLLKGAAVAGAAVSLPVVAEARHTHEVEEDAVGMLFDATKCVGCRACQSACKVSNNLPPDKVEANGGVYDAPQDLNGSTKNIIKAFVDGDQHAYMKQQCMHCVDPSCVSVCMMGALHKEGRGKRDLFKHEDRPYAEVKGTGIVIYDRGLCVGCRYCQIGCAFNVPKFQWDDPIPLIVKCELCNHRREPEKKKGTAYAVANPACCEVCPAQAVIYGTRKELLAIAKARQAADAKKYNPHIYGETEGGGTQVLYLAPAGVNFKQLGLPELPAKSSGAFSEGVSHAPYLYGITPIALYAGLAFVIKKNQDAEQK